MSAFNRATVALCVVLLLTGCFGGKKEPSFDYSAHVASAPRSVVVAPVAFSVAERGRFGIEKRVSATMSEPLNDFLAVVTQPLAEHGYYVMPVRMTAKLAAEAGFEPHWRKETWQNERKSSFGGLVTTLGDAYLLLEPEDEARMKEMATGLAAYFGADSVLFVQVDCWGAKANYSEGLFANMIDEKMDHCMEIDYLLMDARGDQLWRSHKTVEFTRGGGNWVKEIWNASVKPSDDEINAALARDVNRVVIEGKRSRTKGTWFWETVPMLPGPYAP